MVMMSEWGKQKRFLREILEIGCKVFSLAKIMTLVKEEVPANFVPAAAVIRREQALFRMIGCKESVGGYKIVFS